MWKDPEIDAALHLPAPNPFIPDDFTLKEREQKVYTYNNNIPRSLLLILWKGK
jgi:secreted Zn-dependent insulinase-like peptidase